MTKLLLGDTPLPLQPYFLKVKDTHPELLEGEKLVWKGFTAHLLSDRKTVVLEGYGLSRTRDGSHYCNSVSDMKFTVTDVPQAIIRQMVKPILMRRAREQYAAQVENQIKGMFERLESSFFRGEE